jgi:hypothetical protein
MPGVVKPKQLNVERSRDALAFLPAAPRTELESSVHQQTGMSALLRTLSAGWNFLTLS